MCFTVNVNIIREELESRYGSSLLDPEKYRPSYYYHAFAFPELPVVYTSAGGDREIRCLRWGLIPGWVSGAEEADRISRMTHNARSETVAEKPSFEESFRSRRGLLPVKGFFEWQHSSGSKRPWYIFNPSLPIMSLAAIYDTWYDRDAERELSTFSILTTRANRLMSEIHNTKKRMPVIIKPEDEERWLYAEPGDIEDIFEQGHEDSLAAHRVNPSIGNSRLMHNHPGVIVPYSEPDQATLF